jgi:hypothetical protein
MAPGDLGYENGSERAAQARHHRHSIGLGAAAGALLGAALIPAAAAPAAHADPILVSCVIGEGCTETPVGGAPVGPVEPGPPFGGPILISCVIGEGCTETPVGGYPPGSILDPQPGDSGIGLGNPDAGDSFSYLGSSDPFGTLFNDIVGDFSSWLGSSEPFGTLFNDIVGDFDSWLGDLFNW